MPFILVYETNAEQTVASGSLPLTLNMATRRTLPSNSGLIQIPHTLYATNLLALLTNPPAPLLIQSDPCGLQLFHLLSHTPPDAVASTATSLPSDTPPPQSALGGQTLLVDGFYAASILKELHPQYYDLLSRIRIPTHAAGSDDSLYRAIGPILVHAPAQGGERGPLAQVRYNNDDRSVLNGLQACEVEPWYVHISASSAPTPKPSLRYDALRAWHECLTSPDSEYWVQLTPGTLVGMLLLN